MHAVRIAVVLAFAALAQGCATSATNTLPQARRDALKIDAIDLSFAPDASISWYDALDEYKRGGNPDTPEAQRAFLQQKAAGRIKAALNAEVIPAFRGTEPARLKVIVRSVSVAPVVMRLLVGGNYAVKAISDLWMLGLARRSWMLLISTGPPREAPGRFKLRSNRCSPTPSIVCRGRLPRRSGVGCRPGRRCPPDLLRREIPRRKKMGHDPGG